MNPTTALRYKRLDRWDERLRGVTKKAEDKIDESIAEMRARQAKPVLGLFRPVFGRELPDIGFFFLHVTKVIPRSADR